MQRRLLWVLMAVTMASAVVGCRGSREAVPAADGTLDLDRVVLYRNGVGYFERVGRLKGDVLTIKCRKDQVNDILKSLTVVDKSTGQAVSVSMPLDPQSWANAALATLAPGNGDLATILDRLRGTTVTVTADAKVVKGRILMVEAIEDYDDDNAISDSRLILLDDDVVKTVMLSLVDRVVFEDEELSLQLNRTLDASSGEGMFQQVTVEVRLTGNDDHDLLISYVVPAPIWKPTYRVVLPEDPNGTALLQAWAVVDNLSGEDWYDVTLALTSGAPIAFRYDLHTPRILERPDMTGAGTRRRARVAIGETSFDTERKAAERSASKRGRARRERAEAPKRKSKARPRPAPSPKAYGFGPMGGASGPADFAEEEMMEEDADEFSAGVRMDDLRTSTQTNTKARTVSGQTHYELDNRVTVPEGSSTMVAILNESIEAEQAFLFRPGGAGPGYESNPYRVVRFKNSTPFVLEPGPISIYSGGSFVGEGVADIIAADTQATIYFAVEPSIMVSSTTNTDNGDTRLITLTEGTMRIETFQRRVTRWTVKAPTKDKAYKVYVRQPRASSQHQLDKRPEGTEEVPGAYIIPITIEAGSAETTLEVVEQTPVRRNMSIWNTSAPRVLESLLAVDGLSDADVKRLEPLVKMRKEIADIDRRINNLREQKRELDQRASETRSNLTAISKDGRAGALRQKLTRRLDEFTSEGDRIGREIVELTSQRLEKRIELEDALRDFTFKAPEPPKAPEAKDASEDEAG